MPNIASTYQLGYIIMWTIIFVGATGAVIYVLIKKLSHSMRIVVLIYSIMIVALWLTNIMGWLKIIFTISTVWVVYVMYRLENIKDSSPYETDDDLMNRCDELAEDAKLEEDYYKDMWP